MTSAIKINDLGLLRYGKAVLEGRDPQEFRGTFPSEEFVCFGQYKENNEPLWVITLHSFQEKHDCLLEMAFNKKGLFSAELFKKIGRVIADYMFNQACLMRCTAHIRAGNYKSLRLVKAWGFVLEGIKRKGFISPKIEDMHILGLLKEDCVWLSGRQ